MSPLKGIATAGFVLAAMQGTEAARLSDFQGRAHIPDNDKTNCARKALIEEGFGDRGMTQDAFKENGQLVYHFETFGPNGEETLVDVIQSGPSSSIRIDTMKGNPSARRIAIQNAIVACDPSLQSP